MTTGVVATRTMFLKRGTVVMRRIRISGRKKLLDNGICVTSVR